MTKLSEPLRASAAVPVTQPSVSATGSATPSPVARKEAATAEQLAAAPPVLDPTALQKLRVTLGKQADDLMPVLIDNFLKDAPKLIADAQRTLTQNQLTDLRRAAHTLKSTSATFGALALAALAKELEYQARDGKLEGAAELLTRIQAEYAQAQSALDAVRKGK